VNNTVLAITVLVVASATNLPAAAILGAFNFGGSVTVTQNTISWTNTSNLADKATLGATGLTGNFVGLGGTTVTILDLNRKDEPASSTSAQPFMSFDAAPSLGTLLISFVAVGQSSANDCHNPTRLPGQVCTPSTADVPGGSPYMFTNTASDGVHVDGSTAQWTMRGVTSDGSASWSGIWTAQFPQSYQDVLNTYLGSGNGLGSGGAVTGSYSADVLVHNPEPDTTILLGAGLMIVALAVRKLKKS
jgi:hypothetical protein